MAFIEEDLPGLREAEVPVVASVVRREPRVSTSTWRARCTSAGVVGTRGLRVVP